MLKGVRVLGMRRVLSQILLSTAWTILIVLVSIPLAACVRATFDPLAPQAMRRTLRTALVYGEQRHNTDFQAVSIDFRMCAYDRSW